MSETGLAFLLLYVCGLLLALFLRPVYGLYTYVGVFYLHPPSRWWGEALPDLRWSLTAALVTLISLYIHRESRIQRRSWHASTIARMLILYTVWMWLQLPWVASPLQLEGTLLFTKYVVLFYLLYAIIDDIQKFTYFSWAQVIGCAYLGLLAYLAPDGGRLEGLGGPGIDSANSLAMHLSVVLMFAAFLLLSVKGWSRLAIALMIPFILNTIIQTGTRGALVGMLLAGVVTLYLKPKIMRRSYYVLAAIALAGFLVMANQTFVERMSTLTTTFDDTKEWDTSAQSRVETVKAQLRMFRDHPFGVGHQGTAHLSRTYIDEQWLASQGARASHNTVMSVVVDQGIPGILIVGILALSIIRRLRALKRLDELGLPGTLGSYRAMIGAALAAALGSGMFAQFLKAEVQIWCIALLAILCELSAREIAATTDKVLETGAIPKSRRYRLKGAGPHASGQPGGGSPDSVKGL